MHLYRWQIECLKKWEENGCRGIVNVVTGAGKTMLALAAIRKLEQSISGHNLKVKIIVPKTFLVRQWFYAIKDTLGVDRDKIGFFFGTHKGGTDCKYMIYVINSARYSFTRHMQDDAQNHVLIIADECHHYGSTENSKIFDFVGIIDNSNKYYTLGLSATPYCKNYNEVLIPYIGKEIYRLNLIQALNDDIINSFSLFNVGIDFTYEERVYYDDLSEKLSVLMHRLKKFCPYLYMGNGKSFFIQIDNIIKNHKNPEVSELAQSVLFLSYKRKELVYFAESRIDCVIKLVRQINKNAKIIIFGERIEMANIIYEKLNSIMPNKAGLYHSGVHKDAGNITLRKFEYSEIRILVSCKTLDEGLNVSDTDVGIIVSSTSSDRQRIQRLGRVLRKKESGEQAYFYYLYVKRTMEEAEVFKDISSRLIESINVVDLEYDKNTDEFTSAHYDMLTQEAINNAIDNGWADDKIAELKRNIMLGIIKDDWLMHESDCIAKIEESVTKGERNYYTAMLLIIRAKTLGHSQRAKELPEKD